MIVGLTIWKGRISPVADVARQALVIEFSAGKEITRRVEALPGMDLPAQVRRLTALGIQVLICGAISKPMAQMLLAAGVEVISFTAGDVEVVLNAWLAGRLPDAALTMPGCYGRRRCGRGRGRRAASLSRNPDNNRKGIK